MSTLVNKWENADTLNQIKIKSNKKYNTRSHDTKPTPNGVLKIRILPTQKQQTIFKRWLGGSNYTYNMALKSIQHKESPIDFNVLAFKFAVDTDRYGERNKNIPEWLSLTPSAIRKSTLNELVIAHDVARKNRMLGHSGAYTIGRKKKKNQRRHFSFPIPKESTRLYIDPDNPSEYRLDICSSKMKECINNQTRPLKMNYPSSLLDRCRLEQEKLDVQDYYPSLPPLDFKCYDKVMSSLDVILKSIVCPGIVNVKQLEIQDYFPCFDLYDSQTLAIDKLYRKKTRFNVKSKENFKSNDNSHLYSTSIRIHRYSKIGRNKALDKLNTKIEYDCRLCYRYGHWFIHIPYVRETFVEPSPGDKAVAMDPGYATFQGFYSESECGKYQQDVKRLEKICGLLDYYKWCLDNKWHASKYVRLKTNRLYLKQLHLMDEMHTKIINDITSRYNWILLPSFETQEMLKGKGYTKSQRATKRHAAQLSHYKFKQRLIHRCSQMEHCKVLIVSEAWTTKTCSCCGWIWSDMTTSNRVFICKGECGGQYDRDLNAAKNILIRNLTG
jgi:transposase